ncbi:alpha-tubulin suppressor-like RCC1 family protein [Glaciihabitans tibetensis]|uniref:Alpha-tubulin suppressor-like RCC1 family protein n=1 Tax=Glaciihabitans tibetensis TaxID=1266600 RepID=A0A2T0VCC7_9MICO|nr:RCC1 repeat-containing protein [Glaciihabitans tibetensis]PRY67846.1 alpha-tubulin suppressor-like RCC1 family protein [Glaciihabitans tibetensis]
MIRIRTRGRLRAALPTVLTVAFGVSQVLGGGGGFTDQATLSGSSAGTATLAASTPAPTGATATSLDLAWDAVPAGNTAAEFALQRSASADGANPATVYTGTDSSAIDPGNIPTELGARTVTAVSVSSSRACAIADGAVYCWGDNYWGDLGDGTSTNSSIPVAVLGLTGKTATAVSSSDYHSCAIVDGAAYCWGYNYRGILGDGTTTNPFSAVAVVGLSGKTITAITVARYHACALASGSAYCWGINSSGQLGNGTTTDSITPVAVTNLSGKTITAISAGPLHTCAVADGILYCWGENRLGQLGNGTTTNSTTPVAVTNLSGKTITAISAGSDHTCATADAILYCWGNNSYGQLGNGTTTQSPTPVAVPGVSGRNVSVISASNYYTCAVADSTAYCWGRDWRDQLAGGMVFSSLTPVAVPGLIGENITTISGGGSSACVLFEGSSYCWGYNSSGALGDGSTTNSFVPVATSPIPGQVCAAGATSLTSTLCSLTPDTTYYYKVDYGIANWTAPPSAWVAARTAPVTLTASAPAAATSGTTTVGLAWDAAPAGTTGAEYTVQRSTSPDGSDPETVYTGTSTSTTDLGNIPPELRTKAVSTIAVGDYQTCAVADGAAYCWGDNYAGQLGNGTTTNSSTPVAVTGLANKTVTSISTGINHSCAIADGTPYCWGSNGYGQLGNGTTTNSSVPVAVSVPTVGAVTELATGLSHSCVLTADGAAYCWGFNRTGQLGNGTTTDSSIPVAVTGLAGEAITDIAVGSIHSCAVATNGTGYCWGYNEYGQLGNGTTTNSSTPVAVTGLAGTTITDIAAGNSSACALTSDGIVSCWGYNLVGQLGDGTTGYPTAPVTTPVTVAGLTAKSVTGITVGGDSACALISDGTAYCWGNNNYGQVGDGKIQHVRTAVPVIGLADVVGTTITTVTTGQYHSCAVTSDGIAYCWGFNGRGEVGNGTAGQPVRAPVRMTPIAGVACETGATQFTATTCSLTPGTTYYYRVDYTVGTRTSPAGAWTAVATQP